MSKLDSIFGVIVHQCKPDIIVIIYPDGQWVPVCNENPLADIKLFLVNNQWIFNVLLNDPTTPFRFFDVLQYFVVL